MKIEVFKNTVKSSVWGLLEKIFMLLCAFVVRTVIVYKLGAEYVGLDGLFSSILNLLNLSELGLGSAIVFSMYSCIVNEDNDTINKLLFLYRRAYLVIAVAIFSIGIVISFFLKSLIHGDIPNGINVYVLYLMFLLNTVSGYLFASYRTSLFSAYQRNDIKAKIQLISDFIMYGAQILALLVFSNYYFYAGAMFLTIIPRNIMYIYSSRKNFPGLNPSTMPEKAITKGVFDRVIPLLGHKVGGAFLVSIDSIVISAFLGLEMLGKYNNYYYIITAIIGITSIIQQALVAGIGNKIIVLPKEEIFELYLKVSFVWRWIIGQCAICFLCLVQPFITVWIGNAYHMPFYIVAVLSLYYYLWQFRIIGMTFKDAGGLWKSDWYKPYIGMVLNTIVSSVLVYLTKDVVYVLIPTCLIFIFLYFPVESYVISRDIFRVRTIKVILPNIIHSVSIIFAAIITYCICALIPGDGFKTLLLRLMISVTLPNIIMILTWRKSDTFKQVIPYVKKLLKKA